MKIIVYRFHYFNARARGWERSRDFRTLPAIEELNGTPIRDSAREVDADLVGPDGVCADGAISGEG